MVGRYDDHNGSTSRGCQRTTTVGGQSLLKAGRTGIERIVKASKNKERTGAYRLPIKPAKSSGPENVGPERLLPGYLAAKLVLSPTRITLENNGKIRHQPDWENALVGVSGGEGGIRTHGRRKPTTVFETATIDHSVTSPRFRGRLWGGWIAGPLAMRKGKSAEIRWANTC